MLPESTSTQTVISFFQHSQYLLCFFPPETFFQRLQRINYQSQRLCFWKDHLSNYLPVQSLHFYPPKNVWITLMAGHSEGFYLCNPSQFSWLSGRIDSQKRFMKESGGKTVSRDSLLFIGRKFHESNTVMYVYGSFMYYTLF